MQLESSVTLCQVHVYAPMEGPAGAVTDVSKYHLVELRPAYTKGVMSQIHSCLTKKAD